MELDTQLSQLGNALSFGPNLRRALNRAFTEEEQQALIPPAQRVLQNDGKEKLVSNVTIETVIRAFASKAGFSDEQAVIELAHRAMILEPGEYEELLSRIGAVRDTGSVESKPNYCEDGSIRMNNRVIGRVQPRSTKTRLQQVLEAFQCRRWPVKVASPFGIRAAQDLHNTVRMLNQRVRSIRFHVQDGGRAVSWERRRRSDRE